MEGASIPSAGVLPGKEELQEESSTVTTCYREYFNWLYDGFKVGMAKKLRKMMKLK